MTAETIQALLVQEISIFTNFNWLQAGKRYCGMGCEEKRLAQPGK
jgi:hypothetical protein